MPTKFRAKCGHPYILGEADFCTQCGKHLRRQADPREAHFQSQTESSQGRSSQHSWSQPAPPQFRSASYRPTFDDEESSPSVPTTPGDHSPIEFPDNVGYTHSRSLIADRRPYTPNVQSTIPHQSRDSSRGRPTTPSAARSSSSTLALEDSIFARANIESGSETPTPGSQSRRGDSAAAAWRPRKLNAYVPQSQTGPAQSILRQQPQRQERPRSIYDWYGPPLPPKGTHESKRDKHASEYSVPREQISKSDTKGKPSWSDMVEEDEESDSKLVAEPAKAKTKPAPADAPEDVLPLARPMVVGFDALAEFPPMPPGTVPQMSKPATFAAALKAQPQKAAASSTEDDVPELPEGKDKCTRENLKAWPEDCSPFSSIKPGTVRAKKFPGKKCAASRCTVEHPTQYHDQLHGQFYEVWTWKATEGWCNDPICAKRRTHNTEDHGLGAWFDHPDNPELPADLQKFARPWPKGRSRKPLPMYYLRRCRRDGHVQKPSPKYPDMPDKFQVGYSYGLWDTDRGILYSIAWAEAVANLKDAPKYEQRRFPNDSVVLGVSSAGPEDSMPSFTGKWKFHRELPPTEIEDRGSQYPHASFPNVMDKCLTAEERETLTQVYPALLN
ncbi:hypothetical protein LTR20_004322 [Exophiala xenobiotica]|nr:hypothetical protein LTS13_010535 [Exophiala xenobiotica]KAK5398793.1 hypothetical protein LTR79_003791 [Exophiala xenobiotica]KAK5421446.1 hypothetical protein LTR90_002936 [Exophiala xenobiotica]KAK5465904.1 hypothetical protein LTR20_004322 [Exophiala xenobiotica]KAK5484021.1 hypothetical protein LTR83_008817 [Exophiala xenobiotica]